MFSFFKIKQLTNIFYIILIFFIDRISKLLIINLSDNNEQVEIHLTSFLNFNLIWNEGIAFGLLSFDERFGYNFVTVVIFLVIIIIGIILLNAEKLNRIALIMIMGGALGNFFDRIYYSAVPDFIDFYFKGFHWFIFNIADIFISVGVICLIYDEVFLETNRNEK
tara:strand:- start:547 stop:1041 length:495 start_codon:yes stop_codon:yes gene_type:complete